MLALRYLVTQPATGRRATVSWPGAELQGDAQLCAELAPFLSGPAVALRAAVDPISHERGTSAVELAPESEGWVRECLSQAAVRLDLQVVMDLRWE